MVDKPGEALPCGPKVVTGCLAQRQDGVDKACSLVFLVVLLVSLTTAVDKLLWSCVFPVVGNKPPPCWGTWFPALSSAGVEKVWASGRK